MTEAIDKFTLLERISAISAQICDATKPYDGLNGHEAPKPDFVQYELDLAIPEKDAIVQELLAVGSPMGMAKELATIHCDRAHDLIKEYISLYSQTCNDIHHAGSCSTFNNVKRLAEQLYVKYFQIETQWKEEMMAWVRSNIRLQNNSESSNSHDGLDKRPFNISFVPVLELFYTKDPLPSRADKIFLAKKSGMSYKQVHVWFQNRRSRAKRARKEQKGKHAPLPHPQKVQYSSDGETDSDSEGSGVNQQHIWSRCSSFTLVGDNEGFINEPPSHAFPTCYPPPPEFYPFPCQKGDLSMPKAKWPRERTAVPASMTVTEVDMDGLVAMLEKMVIADREDSHPFCLAVESLTFATRPLPAPLSSLIRAPLKFYQPPSASTTIRFDKSTDEQEPHLQSTMTQKNFTFSLESLSAKSARKRSGYSKRVPRGRLSKTLTTIPFTPPSSHHFTLPGYTQPTSYDSRSSSSSGSDSVDSPSDLSDIDDSLIIASGSLIFQHNDSTKEDPLSICQPVGYNRYQLTE